MTNEDREVLRTSILTSFFQEPSPKVQKSLAVLVATVLKVSCEHEHNWNDPILVISEKTKPEQPLEVRMQGFLLLSTLLEVTGEHLTNFYEDLFKFFLQTIRDNSPEVTFFPNWESNISKVRKQTLLCVLNMYTSVSEENLIKSFDEVYPLLLECFYETLRENDEDTVEKVLEMFHTLTENKNVLFDNAKLSRLIDLFCTGDVRTGTFFFNLTIRKAVLNKDINPLFRESMIDIINNILISYKTVISKNEAMMKKIVEVVFTLACIKEVDVKDRDSIQEVALNFIREAGVLLPKKRSYPVYKEYLLKMFESDSLDVLEGAFLILGNLAEGCKEYFRRELPILMKNFIKKGLESQHDSIRKATFYAINFFANYLFPEFVAFHPMVLPYLIKFLDSSDQRMLEGNVLCLDIFCQEMTDEIIMEYVPELIPKLIDVIDRNENTIPVKRHAILTIAACAEVAEEKFAPYAEKLLPLLVQLMNLNDPQFVELKATAIKCVGLITGNCIKQNPEIYSNHIEPIIPLIYENLKHTDHNLVKEFCFQFFFNLSSYLQNGFKPYLEQLVPLTFETIINADKTQLQKPQIVSLDSDSEEEDPNNVWVDDNTIFELSAAIRCIGQMADSCPADYAPYYEETVKYLQKYSIHFHYNVRIQAILCCRDIAKALVKFGSNGELPKFQKGLPCNQRLPIDAENFIFVEVLEK